VVPWLDLRRLLQHPVQLFHLLSAQRQLSSLRLLGAWPRFLDKMPSPTAPRLNFKPQDGSQTKMRLWEQRARARSSCKDTLLQLYTFLLEGLNGISATRRTRRVQVSSTPNGFRHFSSQQILTLFYQAHLDLDGFPSRMNANGTRLPVAMDWSKKSISVSFPPSRSAHHPASQSSYTLIRLPLL
jgi:hypothetical protein